MSFVDTDRTAMDAELARQTLLRLKFEDESRRQTEVRMSIEEEAARAADKVIAGHLYESTQEEMDLNKKLQNISSVNRINVNTISQYTDNSKVRDAMIHLHSLYQVSKSYNYRRFSTPPEKLAHENKIAQYNKIIEDETNKIRYSLKELQENKREEIRLEFITLATERERAKRLEETDAALETIRRVEAAQEAERLRMIQEEAEQRELEFAEYTARMAAVEAEQQEALRLAKVNREIGMKSEKTFNVEAPEPVMTSMSIPTPMLIVGGAALLLLAGRRK